MKPYIELFEKWMPIGVTLIIFGVMCILAGVYFIVDSATTLKNNIP